MAETKKATWRGLKRLWRIWTMERSWNRHFCFTCGCVVKCQECGSEEHICED